MSVKGVTLLEALVILAVVAVLAAIFFPLFLPRGQRANPVVCTDHQRQLAYAILQYAQDNGEMFFPDPGSSAWTQYLNVYGKSYNCPTLSSDGTQSAPEYGFNAHLFGKKLQDIPSPFQTLMTTDLKKSAMTGNFALTSTNPADTHYFETAIDPRHAHHFVYSGADGHAAMVPIESSETISQVMKRKGIVIDPATAPKP